MIHSYVYDENVAHEKNNQHSISFDKLHKDVLIFFLSKWLTVSYYHTIKQLNWKFFYLVEEVINTRKYNLNFLLHQQQLLNWELKCIEEKSNKIDKRLEKIKKQKKVRKFKKKINILARDRKLVIYLKRNTHLWIKTIGSWSFGPRNVWMIIKSGFNLQGPIIHFNSVMKYSVNSETKRQFYNLNYILEKNPTKKWFWVDNILNSEDQLIFVDTCLRNLGWIKFFPWKTEKNIAFLYVHPNEL